MAVIPLRQFADERGSVYHMLKASDPHFLGFGEIYFSSVYPGLVKAWKNHRRVTVNYACIFGRIRLVLYDARDASAGTVMELTVGPDHQDEYALVVVPPGVWHGFQGLTSPRAILASCPTEPYDALEFDRLEPFTSLIPYRWPKEHA